MYYQKDVYPQQDGVDNRTYFRRLIGRINRLKRMIELRSKTRMEEVKSEIREVNEQIRILQKKKENLNSQSVQLFRDIKNIHSEIEEYRKVVVKMVEQGCEPIINISYKTKVYKKTNREYKYYEGRVRMGVRKGLSMKEYYHQFGTHKQCVVLIKKESGVDIPMEHNRKSEWDVKDNLIPILKKEWLKHLSEVEL